MDYFFTEEPISQYSKIIEKPGFKQRTSVIYEEILKHGITIVCLTDINKIIEITGFLCLETTAHMKNSKHPRFAQDLVEYVLQSRNKHLELHTTDYIIERGLCVFPKWRGFGIGAELLKCWFMVCQFWNMKLGVGIFSSTFAQRAAEHAGLIQANSTLYENLRKLYPNYAPEKHTKTLDLYLALV